MVRLPLWPLMDSAGRLMNANHRRASTDSDRVGAVISTLHIRTMSPTSQPCVVLPGHLGRPGQKDKQGRWHAHQQSNFHKSTSKSGSRLLTSKYSTVWYCRLYLFPYLWRATPEICRRRWLETLPTAIIPQPTSTTTFVSACMPRSS
jgi:hypothetical protein